MVAGLVGVAYFVLLSLALIPRIGFIVITVVALSAAVSAARLPDSRSWPTWAGLVGALLMAVPGVFLLLGNLALTLNTVEASTLVNTLLTVSSIGVLYLLPLGIILCLLAGFSRYYQARRRSRVSP